MTFNYLKYGIITLTIIILFNGCGNKYPEGLYTLPEKGFFEQADEDMADGAAWLGAAIGAARDMLLSNNDEYYIYVTRDSIEFVSKVNFISSYDAVLPNKTNALNFAMVFDAKLEATEEGLLLYNEEKKLNFLKVQEDPEKIKAFEVVKKAAIKRKNRIESMSGPEQAYYNVMQAFVAMDFKTLEQLCAAESGGNIKLADLMLDKDVKNIIKLIHPFSSYFADEMMTQSVHCENVDNKEFQYFCSHGPNEGGSNGLPFVKEDGTYKLWLGGENLLTMLFKAGKGN